MAAVHGTKSKWARLLARAIASVAMLSFAYASVACVANSALGLDDHHAQSARIASSDSNHHHDNAPEGSHHADSDSEQPGDDHGSDASCCSSMTSILPSAQQTTANPSQLSWVVSAVLILTADSTVITPPADFPYDHGPPGTAPPVFLSASSLSPRAPPRSV